MKCSFILVLILVALAFPSFAADQNEYLEELLKRANEGNVAAQFRLGMWYSDDEGDIKDDKEAVKWFRMASEQGHAGSQHSLGWMYYIGWGVIKDYKEAVK